MATGRAPAPGSSPRRENDRPRPAEGGETATGQDAAGAQARRPPDRPAGPLVWLHAEGEAAAAGVDALCRALRVAQGDVTLVVTGPEPTDRMPLMVSGERLDTVAPADRRAAVKAFLDRWQPDVAAFVGGGLRPVTVQQAHKRGVALFHFDAPAPRLARGTVTWLPGRTATTLRRFDRILARSRAAQRDLRRAGAPADRLGAAGNLQEGPGPLPHTEAEREALTQILGPRPVWLAAGVPEREERLVIEAHRAAQRLSHRLLMILVPRTPGRGPAIAAALADDGGMRAALRSAEVDPDAETSVLIADTEGEMGLWYRLAPMTFLGGTLHPAAADATPDPAARAECHPFAPAALGSAVIHGAFAPPFFRAALDDLAAAGAARRVRGTAQLSEAVDDLLAPDKAAAMAHKAWEVISVRDMVTAEATRLVVEALAARRAGA